MIALYIIAGIIAYLLIGVCTYYFIIFSERKGIDFEIANYEDAYWQCMFLWLFVWFLIPYFYSKKYRKRK